VTVGGRGSSLSVAAGDVIMADSDSSGAEQHKGKGQNSWLEMSIEIPGFHDDDALSVFPTSMLTETLPARGELKYRLYINGRFHSM